MADAYYVRYWETKENYVAWTNSETDYFSSSKKAHGFIEKYLIKDYQVYAYELGYCEQVGEDYINHEPYDFYNADQIKKKLTIIVAYIKKSIPQFTLREIECTVNDINTGNHLKIAIEEAREDELFEKDSNVFAFEKDHITNFLNIKTKR